MLNTVYTERKATPMQGKGNKWGIGHNMEVESKGEGKGAV